MLDTLRKHLRQYRTLAMDLYDRLEADANQVRNLLALTIDNRTERANPVRLDEDFVFPEVYAWADQREAGGAIDRLEYVVPIRGYNASVPYNKVNIGRPDTVAKLGRIVPKLPPAFMRTQTKLLMNVFRLNPLTVDGQNFFSTAHVYPAGKGTYDNTIDTPFSTIGSPTFEEAKTILHNARARFATNFSIQAEVLSAAEMAAAMVVIVHNSAHWSVFEQVRTQQTRSNITNEMFGTFNLLFDANCTVGQENRIEFVLALPNGPRPAFLVIDMDPALDAWEDDGYHNDEVAIGLQGMFGVKPAHAVCAIQAQEL